MYVVLFLLGIVLGSFLNRIGYNLVYEESKIQGENPSYDIKEGHFIGLLEVLRGNKVLWYFPIMEVFTGLNFVFVYFLYSSGYNLEDLFLYSILMLFLIPATLGDFDKMLVSNIYVVLGSVVILAFKLIFNRPIIISFVSGFMVFVFLYLLMLLTSERVTDEEEILEQVKEIELLNKNRKMEGLEPYEYDRNKLRNYKMGGADVKIMFLVGFTFGFFKSIEILVLASLVVIVFTILLSLISRKGNFNQPVPFFPAITVGVMLSLIINLAEMFGLVM